MIPALRDWISSPAPGESRRVTVSATPITPTSDWPAPTVSTSTASAPHASRTLTASRVALETPPGLPLVARLLMKTPGSVVWLCILTRSPRKAPPE